METYAAELGDATVAGRRLGPGTLDRDLRSIGPWMSNTSKQRSRNVKSAERTLALFELFSLKQRPMQVGEISRELGIPQPSASMLVRNLSNLGYLAHDRAARTYVPTIRIMLLGDWINRRFSDGKALERRLSDIVAQMGETVLLAIQNGVYSQYIRVQMPEKPDLAVQSGLLRPITCTSAGRVLLSLKTDHEIESIVRHCNAEFADERLQVRPSHMLSMVQRVRELGYSETAGDMTAGRSVIAMPFFAGSDRTPMAIGVGGTIANISMKRDIILSALGEFCASSSGC